MGSAYVTPRHQARENSEFAAKYVPQVRLDVVPGLVDYKGFFLFRVNEDQIDRTELTIFQAASLNRPKL